MHKILYSVFALFAAAAMYSIFSGEEKRHVTKSDGVYLSCKGAPSITYSWEVDGTDVIDLDTGAVYNYWYCIPLNAKPSSFDR